MSFASDKLYNGYLRRNMSKIVSRVKVREIIAHLPCLTLHDRETIEAKRDTSGNFNGMMLLLECLRRRENWPEQFIEALEACEQTTMAAEIRAEYDALRGVNNSSPSSPSTTAVRADVHPLPAASHPDNGGNAQAPVAPPAEASAPPQPAANPVHPQAPTSAAAHAPEAVPPPEAPQSPQVEVAHPTSTPPASPQTPRVSSPPPPPPPAQREVLTHQEPEENSESDTQESPDSVETPPLSRPVEQPGTDAPAPTTTAAEVRPPQSPSPTQANSDVTDGSSFLTLTPERPPVQDTAPPLGKIPAVVLEPEETSEPPTAQVIDSSPQRDTAADTASPLPAAAAAAAAAGIDAFVNDDVSVCMSKPGQLISIQPQNHDNPPVPAHNPPAGPYSGNSERLEISEATSDAVTSARVPVCQENGIAPNHNEPEENQYDSVCGSSEVWVSVGHVSEEPSILNLDVQISAPHAQIVNGEAAREISPPAASSSDAAADTVSSSNAASGESCCPSEPAPADITPERKTLPDPEETKKPASHTLSSKYIMTAAGVGAVALLMAWKFKN